MTPETEVKTQAAPSPWVKPTIDRIPLNEAQGPGSNVDAGDSKGGSS